MQKILITGANGFIGRALCFSALSAGLSVKGATRTICSLPDGVERSVVGEIDGNTDWSSALSGCDVLIHLAARAHVMHEKAEDSLAEFRRVNTEGSECLARFAASCGVKRLVYISSIGVNGLLTKGDTKFTEESVVNPHNAYALSKWEAEQILHRVASETGIEVVVVRPPLVYGPGAPGNFAKLMHAVANGVPLPLASVENQRDLIYLGNFVDVLLLCATHPKAAGNTYLVSDGQAISTPNLLRSLAEFMNVPSRLFSLPLWLLRLCGWMVGKSTKIERLVGSLQLDSKKIRSDLGWVPPYTVQDGLKETVIASAVVSK